MLGRSPLGCPSTFLSTFLLVGFREERLVLAGRRIRCKICCDDEVSSIVGKLICVCDDVFSNFKGLNCICEIIPFFFISARVIATLPCTRAVSFWKSVRFLTINFEKSLVPNSRSLIGCTNGAHSLSHILRRLTTSRAAPLPSESQTAPQNRDHSQASSSFLSNTSSSNRSSSSEFSNMGRGSRDTMIRHSDLSYGVKWMYGTPAR